MITKKSSMLLMHVIINSQMTKVQNFNTKSSIIRKNALVLIGNDTNKRHI
jgi:hypothetical protein